MQCVEQRNNLNRYLAVFTFENALGCHFKASHHPLHCSCIDINISIDIGILVSIGKKYRVLRNVRGRKLPRITFINVVCEKKFAEQPILSSPDN